MRILIAVVVSLAFVQGVGVLAFHDHGTSIPGHSHQFVTHGDDHMGHADDVVEVDSAHAELAEGTRTAGRAPVVPPALVAVLAVAALWVVLTAASGSGSWLVPPAPPPRRTLARLSLLRV